jgi:ABC-2 type transport system ATP-binding protein
MFGGGPTLRVIKENLMAGIVIVSANGLSKRYPRCLALDNVTFAIEKGEIVGLVGKNGAGKTTLIRVLTGVVEPTSGTYSLFGISDPKKLVPLRKRIAAMVETPALYENMTPHQNMMTRCLLMETPNPEKSGYIQKILDFVGLSGSYNDRRKIKNYSLGMRQRLGIAMAMVGDPELMILDEPTNGLDPEGIKQIRELLLKLNHEKGITMIISSHILAELEKFATSYLFVDHGKLLKQISAEDLEKQAGKALSLKTSDNPKALSLLLAKGLMVSLSGDTLLVVNLKDPTIALNALAEAQISLLDMKVSDNGLEDFYVNLVGGRAIL